MLRNRMLTKEEEETTDEIEVLAEDQAKICEFSKFNNRLDDLDEQMGRDKEEKEALDDILMELELSDEDDIIPYQMSSTFLHLPVSEVLAIIQKKNEKLEQEMENKQTRMDECRDRMSELKVALKGKFGNAINLDR